MPHHMATSNLLVSPLPGPQICWEASLKPRASLHESPSHSSHFSCNASLPPACSSPTHKTLTTHSTNPSLPPQSLNEPTAFYLLALLGAGSLPGRLLAPLLGDRFGPLNLYPFAMALAGVLALAWPHTTSYGALIALCLLYGFAYGAIVSLPPPAVAAMTRDVRTLGTRIGLCFSFAGVSVLVGPPIAGAIEARGGGREKADFEGLFVFAGVMMLVGSVCLGGVAWLNWRKMAREREREQAEG